MGELALELPQLFGHVSHKVSSCPEQPFHREQLEKLRHLPRAELDAQGGEDLPSDLSLAIADYGILGEAVIAVFSILVPLQEPYGPLFPPLLPHQESLDITPPPHFQSCQRIGLEGEPLGLTLPRYTSRWNA
jgi:hypothetical protein